MLYNLMYNSLCTFGDSLNDNSITYAIQYLALLNMMKNNKECVLILGTVW